MTKHCRLFRVCIGTALVSLAAAAAQAQEAPKKATRANLPSQVIPTGAEDASRNASAAARSSGAANQATQLESELLRMTDESSAGLVAVEQSDGSVRVNLEDRFMSVVVATPTSDGGQEITCHTGQEARDKVAHARLVSAGALPKPKKTGHAPPQAAPAVLEEK